MHHITHFKALLQIYNDGIRLDFKSEKELYSVVGVLLSFKKIQQTGNLVSDRIIVVLFQRFASDLRIKGTYFQTYLSSQQVLNFIVNHIVN